MAKSHSFEPAHAQAYGLEEAIIIHHFSWWIEKNRVDGKNLFEGRTWSYNSYAGIAAHFSYLNPRKVRGALDKLVEFGVLMKRPGAKGGMNHYAFTDEAAFTDPKLKPPPDKIVMGVADGNSMGNPDKNDSPAPCQKSQGDAEKVMEGDENGSPSNKGTDDSQLLETDTRNYSASGEEEPRHIEAINRAFDPSLSLDQRAHRLYNTVLLPVAERYHTTRPNWGCEQSYRGNIETWLKLKLVITPDICERALVIANKLFAADCRKKLGLTVPTYPDHLNTAIASLLKGSAPTTPAAPKQFTPPPVIDIDPEQKAREDAEMAAIEEQMRKVDERWKR